MKADRLLEVKSYYSFEAPVFSASVPAGKEKDRKTSLITLDLNSFLAPVPDDIFLVHVNGESMIDENIYDGDILIVNSREAARDGKIVIAALNGELAVKQYRILDDIPYLVSANKNFLPIEIKPFMEFQVQGVVKHVIHSL